MPFAVGVTVNTAAKITIDKTTTPHRTPVAQCDAHLGPRMQPTKRTTAIAHSTVTA